MGQRKTHKAPEMAEYSNTATPRAYAAGVPVYCAHDDLRSTNELVMNPQNPNQHPPEQIKALGAIIRAAGWRAPITVSNRSGLIVKGHGRLMAAQLEDLPVVPVEYQDYATEAEELADLTADNRLAELSETDSGLLAEVFAKIEASDIPFMLSGYSEDEYGQLMADLSEAILKQEQEDEYEADQKDDNGAALDLEDGEPYTEESRGMCCCPMCGYEFSTKQGGERG